MLEVWYTTICPTHPKVKELFGNSNFVHRFLIWWGQFGNRCRYCSHFGYGATVILDFRSRVENHCRETLKNSPGAAAILDFGIRFGNRCSVSSLQRREDNPRPGLRGGGREYLRHRGSAGRQPIYVREGGLLCRRELSRTTPSRQQLWTPQAQLQHRIPQRETLARADWHFATSSRHTGTPARPHGDH